MSVHLPMPILLFSYQFILVAFHRLVFNKIPHAAGTGAGAKPASDAPVFIHPVLIAGGNHLHGDRNIPETRVWLRSWGELCRV